MELYLIRHAQAEPLESGRTDAQRKLTLKGHDQARALRKTLESLGVHLDMVYTSPWRRARQTASALEPVAERLETLEELASTPRQPLLKHIHGLVEQYERVALIGHQPWLGELTSLLLTADASFASSFEYRKCALYALEFSPAHCFLRFVLPSGVLRRLS